MPSLLPHVHGCSQIQPPFTVFPSARTSCIPPHPTPPHHIPRHPNPPTQPPAGPDILESSTEGQREAARSALRDKNISTLTGAAVSELVWAGGHAPLAGEPDLVKRLVCLKDSEGQAEVSTRGAGATAGRPGSRAAVGGARRQGSNGGGDAQGSRAVWRIWGMCRLGGLRTLGAMKPKARRRVLREAEMG